MKRAYISWLQLLTGTLLIAVLIWRLHSKGTLADIQTAALGAAAGWPWLLAATGVILVCLFAGGFRWYTLMRSIRIDIRFKDVFILMLTGHFFNLLMPGAVSGDFIKGWYVMQHAGERRTEAFASVFIDRIVGFVTLICMASALMIANYPRFSKDPLLVPLLWICTIFAILLLLMTGLYYYNKNPLLTAAERLLSRSAYLAARIARIKTVLQRQSNTPNVTAIMVAASLVNHLGMVFCGYFIAKAMALPLAFIDALAVFPVVSAIVLIPLTPGGLGTREAVTVLLLSRLGIAEAQALILSLLFYSTLIVWSIAGGITYALLLKPAQINPEISNLNYSRERNLTTDNTDFTDKE